MTSFRLGLTRDFLKADGSLGFGDIGLSLLEGQPGIAWEFLAEPYAELPPEVADKYDALLVLAPKVTAATVKDCRRLGLVARFGVGYDNVDVPACTQNAVMLTITPDGVRRPVASSVLAFLLALAHRLPVKDRLTREGRWAERLNYMGYGLTGKTLGVIGLGNIGREVFRLAAPWGMQHITYDPHIGPEQAAAAGALWLPLEELLSAADYVVVCCALSPDTFHLLNGARLGRMKPTANLINVARGPIVDQAALTGALQQGKLAGAALDVFEQEPIDPHDPLLALENVILAPHAICWTDECFLNNGRSAVRSILDYAAGRAPQFVVNRDVLEMPQLQQKLAARGAAAAPSSLRE